MSLPLRGSSSRSRGSKRSNIRSSFRETDRHVQQKPLRGVGPADVRVGPLRTNEGSTDAPSRVVWGPSSCRWGDDVRQLHVGRRGGGSRLKPAANERYTAARRVRQAGWTMSYGKLLPVRNQAQLSSNIQAAL